MKENRRFYLIGQKLLAGVVIISMLVALLPSINLQADTPQPVRTDWHAGPGVYQISTSGNHTVAIQTDGSLWAWGENRDGQLGDGTTISRYNPMRIGMDYDWMYVVAGVSYGSSATYAIRTDGSLWVWGWGVPDTPSGYAFVPTRFGTDYDWVSVSLGTSAAAAAIKKDGSLWTWMWAMAPWSPYHAPTRYGEDYDWASVSTGNWGGIPSNQWPRPLRYINHRAIRADDSLWVGGRLPVAFTNIGEGNQWLSTHGNGGLGIAIDSNGGLWRINGFASNEPIRHSEDYHWLDAVAGTRAVALSDDGRLWMDVWTSTGSSVATEIMPLDFGNDWERLLAAGHTAQWQNTFAMKADGTVWAFGANRHGSLGDGTTISRQTPVLIWGQYTGPTLAAGSTSTQPGNTVRIPVSLNNNPGIAGFNITINYDNNILTPAPLNDGDIRRDLGGSVFVSNINHSNGAITAVWASSYEVEGEYLFYIYFTVNQDASISTQATITITIDELKRLNHDNVIAATRSGVISVVDGYTPPPPPPLLWGDVNQDGYVDIFDLIRLAQHISGTPGMALTGVGLQVADVFYDGAVNLSDLIHLAQYLASEDMNNPDVVLGPGSR